LADDAPGNRLLPDLTPSIQIDPELSSEVTARATLRSDGSLPLYRSRRYDLFTLDSIAMEQRNIEACNRQSVCCALAAFSAAARYAFAGEAKVKFEPGERYEKIACSLRGRSSAWFCGIGQSRGYR
jgi:hypothetical protein